MDARFDTVCTTTSENIDRSHRRIQHANLAGLEHISMVKNFFADPAAKIDQDESSRVLRHYIVCESQIQIFPIIGQRHWRMYGPNMDLSNKCIGSPRSAIHLVCITWWFYYSIQQTFSGTFQRANSRLFWWKYHFHVYVQRHWMDKERQCRYLFAQCQRSGNICGSFQAKTLVFSGVCVNTWWNNIPIFQGIWDIVALQMVDILKFHTSHPIFPAKEKSVEELRKQTISKVHSTTRRFSSRPCWQAIYCVLPIEFVNCVRLNIRVPTPRTAEDE